MLYHLSYRLTERVTKEKILTGIRPLWNVGVSVNPQHRIRRKEVLSNNIAARHAGGRT